MISLFGKPQKVEKAEPSLIDRLKASVTRTKEALSETVDNIFLGEKQIDPAALKQLETALLTADLGVKTTREILDSIKEKMYRNALSDTYQLKREIKLHVTKILETPNGSKRELAAANASPDPRVIFIVGVNGAGKTTSIGKLANRLRQQNLNVVLCAADTFRAAAIEQLKLWGQRLKITVIAGADKADPASVAHDAITAANARHAQYLFVDTAGRLHTKHNLMQELQKLHRVMGKQSPGAPHEVLLVLDATTGMNALNQAREFHKTVPLTGLVVTKLDGTSKGGMVVAIQKELGLPIKFIGLGEQADDLQPFDPRQFAEALFEG